MEQGQIMQSLECLASCHHVCLLQANICRLPSSPPELEARLCVPVLPCTEVHCTLHDHLLLTLRIDCA